MGRIGVVAGVTMAALLVAVVAVRGGTAADEADLAVGLEQPSPEPSPEPTGQRPLVLDANGLPGARLGAAPGRQEPSGLTDLAGCQWVWDPGGWMTDPDLVQQPTWETSAWVVDDEVVAVVLGAWHDPAGADDALQTWLGPTLGSPIEAAQELPGATTVVERPFGTLGPTVRVVTVPGQGIEVVLSDLPLPGAADRPFADAGRITTIELRRPGARDCALDDLDALGATRPQGWTVDVDGLGPLRLGTAVDDLVATDGVRADGSPYDTGGVASCQGFVLAGEDRSTGFARALAVDGVVTEVQVWDTGLATSFGLPTAADADDIRARFPEVAARSGPLMGSGAVRVVVDEVDVELLLQHEAASVPDLERPVEGGVPTVAGVTVRTPGAPVSPC